MPWGQASMYHPNNCLYQGVYRQWARITVRWRNQSFRDSLKTSSFVWGLCWFSSPPFFVTVLFLLLLYPVILLERLRGETEIFSHCPQLTKCIFFLSRTLYFVLSTSFLYRRGLVWAGHHCRKCFFSLIWGATALCRQQRCPWPHRMTLFSQLKLASLSILLHVHILYSSSIFCNLPFIFFTLICPFFLFWGLVSASHFTNETYL